MQESEYKRGKYRYNGDDQGLKEIVDIIDVSVKNGLLRSTNRFSRINKDNKEEIIYRYNFLDNDNGKIKDYEINIIIPLNLYDENNLDMHKLNKYSGLKKENKTGRIKYTNKKALCALVAITLVVSTPFVMKTKPVQNVIDKIIEWDNENYEKEVESWQENIDLVNQNKQINDQVEYYNNHQEEIQNDNIEDELNSILNHTK